MYVRTECTVDYEIKGTVEPSRVTLLFRIPWLIEHFTLLTSYSFFKFIFKINERKFFFKTGKNN